MPYTPPTNLCDAIAGERWLPVVGFWGYEISDAGRIRSYRTKKAGVLCADPVFLKTRLVKGYAQINLVGPDGNGHELKVHAALLGAFVGPRPPGMQGCHWDGDPTNNILTNLRWDTVKANHDDRRRHGRKMGVPGERHYKAKFTNDDIRCIRAEPYYVGVVRMLATAFGVAPQTIKKVRARKSWAHVPQYL